MSERINYDILKFSFSCKHECHEWKWDICKHCRSRCLCKDHIRDVYPSEEGIYYATERFEVSVKHVEDLGTYVHEITEDAIIQILRELRKDWNRSVKFKGYNKTYITHFISLYGTNNNTCLEPVTKRNRPRW